MTQSYTSDEPITWQT